MLMRFDPFREFDRMTEEAFRPTRLSRMPMDGYRRGDVFVVHFDLPGVDPDTIDLTVEQNTLTVTAERTGPLPRVTSWSSPSVSKARSADNYCSATASTPASQPATTRACSRSRYPSRSSQARKVQVARGGGPEVIEATSSGVGNWNSRRGSAYLPD